VAGPALADPPGGVTPRAADVVGAGSDTVGYLLDQLAHSYDAAHPHAASLLYGFDATSPATGGTGDQIVTKAGCPSIARPDGSSAGITALEANTTDPASPGDFCIDFAGTSRGPSASDPACGTAGGICFIELAGDTVTWAARDAASGGTDAPASLTVAQLRSIYRCKVTNWAKVGGKKGTIEPFLPQSSSGITAAWLTALGGGTTPLTPGPCVSDGGGTLQDDQGISAVLDSAQAIVPYSAASYIAQAYHDAPCTNSGCTGPPVCTPTAKQNMFGCDEHGVLGLGEINGKSPLLPWPAPPPPCAACAINVGFPKPFFRPVGVAVRSEPTAPKMFGYLSKFFGPKGASCSRNFNSELTAYGFTSWPAAGPRLPGVLVDCGISQHRPDGGPLRR